MSRKTYISNGSRELANRRHRRRWWLMAAWNTACMLLFTASMVMLAIYFMDHLG